MRAPMQARPLRKCATGFHFQRRHFPSQRVLCARSGGGDAGGGSDDGTDGNGEDSADAEAGFLGCHQDQERDAEEGKEAEAGQEEALGWREALSDWILAPFDSIIEAQVQGGLHKAVEPLSAASDVGLPMVSAQPLLVVLAALLGSRLNRPREEPGADVVKQVIGRRAKPARVSPEQKRRAREAAQRKREEAIAAEQAKKEMESREFQEALQQEQERLKQEEEMRRERERQEEEERRRRREEARKRLEEEKERQRERERQEEEERRRREQEAEEARKRRQQELEEERRRKEEEFRNRGGRYAPVRARGKALAQGQRRGPVSVSIRCMGQDIEREESVLSETALRSTCWDAASAAAEAFKGQVRSQSLAGRGLLCETPVDEPFLEYLAGWLHARAASAATAACVKVMLHGGSQDFQISFELPVLPAEDSESLQYQLQQVLQESSNEPKRAVEILEEVASREGNSVLSCCLVCAHLLNRSDTNEARSVCENALLRRAKQEGDWRSFFLDSPGLKPDANDAANAADLLFGEDSFLASILRRICGAEQRVEVHEVEEEFPDEAELRRLRREEVEAKTPVPERVWALRNSAYALAQTGALRQAIGQLRKAVSLKVEWLQEEIHPAVLGELRDLAGVLHKGGARDESRALREDILNICCEAARRLQSRGEAEEGRRVLRAALAECQAELGDGNERVVEARAMVSEGDGERLELEEADRVLEGLAQRFSPKIEVQRRAGEPDADLW